MNLIQTLSLAGVSTITSATLPTSYRHLRMIGLVRSTRAGVDNSSLLIRFNGDTGTNYQWQSLFVSNTTVSAFLFQNTTDLGALTIPAATSPAGDSCAIDFLMPLYNNTTFQKVGNLLSGERINATTTGFRANMRTSEWKPASPAAITTITFVEGNSQNFATGSFVDIYGIA